MGALRIFGGDAPSPENPPPRGWAQVPHITTFDLVLSDSAVRVYNTLRFFIGAGSSTCATDAEIGAKIGKARSAVSDAVGQLVDAGHILRATSGGHRRLSLPTSPEGVVSVRNSEHEAAERARNSEHQRPEFRTPAPGIPNTSARNSGRALNVEEKEKNLRTSAAAEGPREGPKMPPTKRGEGNPPPTSAAPPPPIRQREPNEPDQADVMTPEARAWWVAVAEGNGHMAPVARGMLGADRAARAWYDSRGLPLPTPDTAAQEADRQWLSRLGLLPESNASDGKTTGPG
jgi:hypothetical protein